jgi:hypothetical protein
VSPAHEAAPAPRNAPISREKKTMNRSIAPSPPAAAGRVRRTLAYARLVLWRIGREQSRTLVLAPLAIVAVMTFAGLAAFAFPQWLTGPTHAALQRGAAEVLHVEAGGRGRLEAFIALQAPYLLATFTGFAAASFARSLIFADVARGAMEVLLSTERDVVELALANLLALAVLTLATLAFATAALVGIAALPGSGVDVFVLLREARGGTLIALLVAVCALSVEIAMGACLLYPKLSGAQASITFSPLQIVCALPGIALTLLVSLEPASTRWLPAFTLAAVVLGGGLYALLMRRLFDPRLYLAS